MDIKYALRIDKNDLIVDGKPYNDDVIFEIKDFEVNFQAKKVEVMLCDKIQDDILDIIKMLIRNYAESLTSSVFGCKKMLSKIKIIGTFPVIDVFWRNRENCEIDFNIKHLDSCEFNNEDFSSIKSITFRYDTMTQY